MRPLLGFFLCLSAWAQTNLSVQATATQALVTYRAPLSASCTIQVSESPTYLPPVPDVDFSLFANADLEATHIIDPVFTALEDGTTVRNLRIGMRAAARGLDGRWHSRALGTVVDGW